MMRTSSDDFCEMPIWGFRNFHTIHRYQRGEMVEEAVILPALALNPATPDAKTAASDSAP